ncbi:hypothetical protein NDU88_006196 [Pleurodeles waltl]|uniref:Uncharacterized protein n=1 Tax=Pleurodeles waltl TaxID=8319 RepID=A0AAV7SNW5_PLEWA|nr:hypothetical protein NDU88_006196 [Pleurodeles waltl]
MGRHKRTDISKGNTMEQYTTPLPLPHRPARSDENVDNMRVPVNPEEPSRAELLAAIQGSKVALEGKIETVAVEVNLLRADLRKVSNKVRVAEGSIVELQIGVGFLRKQMLQASSPVGWPEARSCEAGQLVDARAGGSPEDSSHRVEIQQDETMEVVSTGLAGGRDVELG